MTKVTKESLSARIAELESGTRSIKEDYQLEAYRMLLQTMETVAQEFHMDEALDIFNSLKLHKISESFENKEQGIVGQKVVQVWSTKIGGTMEYLMANGGCSLKLFLKQCVEGKDDLYDVIDEDNNVLLSGVSYNEAQSETDGYMQDNLYIVEHEPSINIMVPNVMTPKMMRDVQLYSELGSYAASNLSDAYSLFSEFWEVACRSLDKDRK